MSAHGNAAGARGLYLLTPDDADTGRLVARVAEVLAEATWLQYRNKSADARLRREQVRALLAPCAAAGVPLLVNDDWRLAADAGAAGVHLGEGDGPIARARDALGPRAILGASCYDDLGRARAAAAEGADYVAFGAFFPTATKATTRRATTALLREAGALGLPRVAIGGIGPATAAPLVAAGADLLAVIGAVFDADDPAAAARALRRAFDAPPTPASDDVPTRP